MALIVVGGEPLMVGGRLAAWADTIPANEASAATTAREDEKRMSTPASTVFRASSHGARVGGVCYEHLCLAREAGVAEPAPEARAAHRKNFTIRLTKNYLDRTFLDSGFA